MIGSLRGTVMDRDVSGRLLVDVQGVGYDVAVTAPTVASVGEIGTQVFLWVHTRVREDAITLYGFASPDERRCFDLLISAHGVGPAVALALLTVHPPSALVRIVASDDIDALSQVPGIGKKTATRLLMELKSKLDLDLDSVVALVGGPGIPAQASAQADVAAALTGLGYGTDEIRLVLATLPPDGSTEDLLRLALRSLAASA